MLASGSFPSVRAADLPAGVDHQRADPALVSFVVSFGYVRNRSECPTEDGQPRSRTVATYAVPRRADLESVLAATGERKGPLISSAPEAFSRAIVRVGSRIVTDRGTMARRRD